MRSITAVHFVLALFIVVCLISPCTFFVMPFFDNLLNDGWGSSCRTLSTTWSERDCVNVECVWIVKSLGVGFLRRVSAPTESIGEGPHKCPQRRRLSGRGRLKSCVGLGVSACGMGSVSS